MQTGLKQSKLSSVIFRGSILWNAISDEIKSSQSKASFKVKIKSWNGDNCNCNIRKLAEAVNIAFL